MQSSILVTTIELEIEGTGIIHAHNGAAFRPSNDLIAAVVSLIIPAV
jgi:hypothetical protein